MCGACAACGFSMFAINSGSPTACLPCATSMLHEVIYGIKFIRKAVALVYHGISFIEYEW